MKDQVAGKLTGVGGLRSLKRRPFPTFDFQDTFDKSLGFEQLSKAKRTSPSKAQLARVARASRFHFVSPLILYWRRGQLISKGYFHNVWGQLGKFSPMFVCQGLMKVLMPVEPLVETSVATALTLSSLVALR